MMYLFLCMSVLSYFREKKDKFYPRPLIFFGILVCIKNKKNELGLFGKGF